MTADALGAGGADAGRALRAVRLDCPARGGGLVDAEVRRGGAGRPGPVRRGGLRRRLRGRLRGGLRGRCGRRGRRRARGSARCAWPRAWPRRRSRPATGTGTAWPWRSRRGAAWRSRPRRRWRWRRGALFVLRERARAQGGGVQAGADQAGGDDAGRERAHEEGGRRRPGRQGEIRLTLGFGTPTGRLEPRNPGPDPILTPIWAYSHVLPEPEFMWHLTRPQRSAPQGGRPRAGARGAG